MIFFFAFQKNDKFENSFFYLPLGGISRRVVNGRFPIDDTLLIFFWSFFTLISLKNFADIFIINLFLKRSSVISPLVYDTQLVLMSMH